MPALIDLTGQRFGRLTVLERNGVKDHHAAWLCKCDCGNEKVVSGRYLTAGKIVSCGCYLKEITIKRSTTHGMCHSRLYTIWANLFVRCYSQKNWHYKWYGGKGVKVCKEWHEFEPFMKWALSHGYSDDLTLDRIDNDGDYEPSNCQWITMKAQVRKQDRTLKYIVCGAEYTLSELEELTGVRHKTMYARVHDYGLPLLTEEELNRMNERIKKNGTE